MASLVLATAAAAATAAVIGLTGCTLYFDHGGDDGDDDPPRCEGDLAAGAALRLVNPTTLACQTFGSGTCDDSCGPCPANEPYIPAWGSCDSACIGKSESACAADPGCYVAKEASAYYSAVDPRALVDDFLGCYPVSTGPIVDNAAGCVALTAEQCTADSSCTAIYDAPYGTGCGGLKTATPEQCPGAQFVACVAEGLEDPGVCSGAPIACDALPPQCPQGQSPGEQNGCWTGACIPDPYCGVL